MDTLAVDTLSMAAWRDNPEFNYASDFQASDFSLTEWLNLKIAELLNELFGNKFYKEWGDTLWYAVGLAAIIAVAVFIVYKHPHLFGRRRHARKLDYDVEDDNIYGFDFEAETEAAMRSGNYRRAVRMAYLHTLRLLSDAGRIVWLPSKTPTAYMQEYAHPRFAWMTHQFMRIRYGGFDASHDLAQAMTDTRIQITTAIHEAPDAQPRTPDASGAPATPTTAHDKNGGER